MPSIMIICKDFKYENLVLTRSPATEYISCGGAVPSASVLSVHYNADTQEQKEHLRF